MLVVFTAQLLHLRQRCEMVKSLCWAEATWRTRRSQWKKYNDFCTKYELVPAPASVDTICLYITHLTYSLKYSTICNYLSAVWSLHEYLGFPAVAKNAYLIKCTMRGAHRLLGDSVLTADPLLPEDFILLYRQMDFSNLTDLVFWSALVLMYRCLLRKGHVTASPHNILRSHLEFTTYGACLTITSSKTIQFRERVVQVPIVKSHGSVLCPVRWLCKYLARVRVNPGSPLFVMPKSSRPMTYAYFSGRLKRAIQDAGLVGRYTSHSLRRGAATYLSRLGLPLHDIKLFGDWRSLSVLLYLSGDIHTRLLKDSGVAKQLEVYRG